jgi:hypothetical protein
LLEGDKEGCAETLGRRREEVPLLKPVLLEGHEEGCAETLGEAELEHGELEGPEND